MAEPGFYFQARECALQTIPALRRRRAGRTTGGRVRKQIDVIAAVLVVVGALNWGLIAVARFDLVAALFGTQFGEVSTASAPAR